MDFTKQEIIDFKMKQKSFFLERKNFDKFRIKDVFYNDNNTLFSLEGKKVEYKKFRICDFLPGDYRLAVKYTTLRGIYYLFILANTFWAPPYCLAVGRAVEGIIYLIAEIPGSNYSLNLYEIPEAYVTTNNKPVTYKKCIYFGFNGEPEEMTDEDVKCVNYAYKGVEAFNRLMTLYYKSVRR